MPMIEIPEVLANKAESLGATGWLTDLGETVAGLEWDWGITVGRPYRDGTEGWVAEAVDAGGRPVVLKLCVPRPGDDPWIEARREAEVLGRAGGGSCAELHRFDEARGALLIERLGPSLADLDRPYPERLELLAVLASRFWVPGAGIDLPSGVDKATRLAEFIEATWSHLGRPCGRAAVDQALAASARRAAAHDAANAVLVHGDIHRWNTLRVLGDRGAGGASGWKLIDPDGLVAEPECDLGVLLREDPAELLVDIAAGCPRRRAEWLADRTGTDADAIWDWGVVERVSTGLLATSIDLQPVGSQMLEAADRLAELA